uniref:Uncharacterized protein n=1 Tax=Wuchereria bancrofti TaxID=6293 RepID=A0AAF5PQ64_WUCBA
MDQREQPLSFKIDNIAYTVPSNASTGNNADLLSNTTQTVNLRTSSNQVITFSLQFFVWVQQLINEQKKLRQQILQQVIAREIRALSQQLDEQQKKRPRSIHPQPIDCAYLHALKVRNLMKKSFQK